jgi:hypothetical protein
MGARDAGVGGDSGMVDRDASSSDGGARDAARADAARDAGPDAGPPDLCATVDCSSLDGPCVAGVCDPADGTCAAEDRPAGTTCDDGNLCTATDTCSAGSCAGTPVDCSMLTDVCNVGSCNAVTGACAALPRGDGTVCDDGDTCTTGDACRGGVCSGTPGGCGGGTLVPGRTDLIASMGGWHVRCLGWTGRTCIHGQAMMDCSVCPGYTQCGVWHDVTTFNDGENRCSGPFCALATGNGTVLSTGTGAAATTAPRACGWGDPAHPICSAARASFHPPLGGIDPNYGLLLDEAYCSFGTTLRTFDCAGW